MKELGNAAAEETGRWVNNRAENSHLPFRRRERAMLRFRQMHTLQKFSSVHASVHDHFNQERHLISRQDYKAQRSEPSRSGGQSQARTTGGLGSPATIRDEQEPD